MFHRKPKDPEDRNVGPLFALFAAGTPVWGLWEGHAASSRQAREGKTRVG